MQNLLLLKETPAEAAMTPGTVVFSLPETLSVGEFHEQHEHQPFSRISLYRHDLENVTGFVLRSDLLLAQASGQADLPVAYFCRDIGKILESLDLSKVFDRFMKQRAHIMLVVDEYGGMSGILTLEDVLETQFGLEIVDEFDTDEDMQVLARKLWKTRAKQLGLVENGEEPERRM